MMRSRDILERLRIDPCQRTLGQLLQDREAAAYEIRKLRSDIERLSSVHIAKSKWPNATAPHIRTFRPGTLLRIGDVCELIGASRSAIYRWVSEGTFPEPVRIGERAVRWNIDEINEWRKAL